MNPMVAFANGRDQLSLGSSESPIRGKCSATRVLETLRDAVTDYRELTSFKTRKTVNGELSSAILDISDTDLPASSFQ